MRKLRFFRSAAAMFMVVLTLFWTGVVPVNTSAATLSELQEQQSSLEKQKEDNDALLEKLKDDTANKKEYRDTLNAQIKTVQDQCDLLVVQIRQLDDEIAKAETDIADTQDSIDANYETLKERIKAIYMTGDSSDISIVLNSSSIMDYTQKQEVLQAMTAHDKQLIDELSEELESIQDKLTAIKANKQELSKRKKEMDSKSNELSELYDEAQKLLEEAEASEADAQAEAERIAKEKEEADAAIDAWYDEYRKQQAASGGGSSANLGGDAYVGVGNFIWPMPGYTYITCYFGDGGHRGIDIAGGGIYGKSIVAADGGTIAYAGWMDSYGNCVFIDHGNGYQTRYAHMSAVACTVGQSVAQGQVIGYVGSTGNSTGPHLHFEIIYGDSLLNPFSFF